MTYLLDTDFLSLATQKKRPHEEALRWLARHEQECCLPVVAMAEARFGAEQAPEDARQDLLAKLGMVREQFAGSILGVGEDVLVRWKQLLRDLKTARKTMTCEDTLIAATALQHDLTVVTRNTSHFAHSGCRTFNPIA